MITSFRHDKRKQTERKKLLALFVLFLCVLFIFRTPVQTSLSAFLSIMARPLWKTEYTLSGWLGNVTGIFRFKSSLVDENRRLQDTLDLVSVEAHSREDLRRENEELKAVLGRKGERDLLLARVLATPARSPYDTLLIDIGEDYGLATGMKVYADGDFVLGEISQVDPGGAIVTLYSSPGKEIPVTVGTSSTPAIARGEGGGNFRMTLPKGLAVLVGDLVSIPSFGAEYTGVVRGIDKPEGGSLQYVYLSWPFNINELRFVYVETSYREQKDVSPRTE